MNALKLEAASRLGILRGGSESERGAAALELIRASESPAVASDMAGHVLMWNAGAEKLLGRPAHQALGRRCHDLLAGRDVFGNRFCHEDCAVRAMCRRGEVIQAFELVVDSRRPTIALHVSILKIPGARPDVDAIVHLLEPIDRQSRLARELERLGVVASPGAPLRTSASPQADDLQAPLSPREREVLERMAEGLQNKEIAQKLDISLATVRNHVHNMLEKLGVHSKLEAVSLAYRGGWVPGRPRAARLPRSRATDPLD